MPRDNSLKSKYVHGKTPEERLAVAVKVANQEFTSKNPFSVAPGLGFYEDFLRPFITRELLEAEISILHKMTGDLTKSKEKELLLLLAKCRNLCEDTILQLDTRRTR